MLNIKQQIAPLFNAQLVTNFFTYCIGAIFIRGISLLLLPFILHTIPPHEYGTFSLLTAGIAIATTLFGLGLRQLLSIEYFHANQQEQRSLIQDILSIYTIIAVPSLFLIWGVRAPIIRIIFFNTVSAMQFGGALICIFFFFYTELMYQLLQYQQAVKQLILLQCTAASCLAVGTLYTIFYLRIGITGIIWVQTMSTCLMATIAFWFLYKNYLSVATARLQPTWYYLKHGVPFIPGMLANWTLTSANRWLLGYYQTMHHVGIYAVAELASQLFYIIILQSWAASYLPYIMQQYQQEPENIPIIEAKNHRIMWFTMGGLALLMILGYPIAYMMAVWMLPPTYLAAMKYAWILLTGQLFLLGTYFAAALIQYAKRTYFLAAALCVPAFINILLNCLFIPYAGIMGCSLATLLSYAIYFMIIYHYNKKIIVSCYIKGES